MKRISPLDLESAQLPISKKGYQVEAVDALLKTAADEISDLLKSNEELSRSLQEERRELASFRLRESTLAEALLLAQRTADETRAAAHAQADLIVNEARHEAKEVRLKATLELEFLERKIEQRERDKANFETRFLNLLNEYQNELSDSDNIYSEDDLAA